MDTCTWQKVEIPEKLTKIKSQPNRKLWKIEGKF